MRLRLVFGLLLGVIAGCSGGGRPVVTLHSLSPSTLDADGGEVEIRSDGGFVPVAITDLSQGGGSRLEATFAAALAPSAGGASFALEAVERVSDELIRARVPAGLSKGVYDLSLTDPVGRVARLDGALQVVTSAESVAGFRFEQIGLQRLGVPFTVLLTAVDQSGLAVDGFAQTVTLTGEDGVGGAVSVLSEPFVLGRGKAEVDIGTAGTWTLAAQDARGRQAQSAPFEVRAGLPVRARILAGPTSAPAGACAGPLRFQLEDLLGNAADLQSAVLVAFRSFPEGTAFFTDPACAGPAPDLAVSAPAEVYFRPDRAGSLQLHLLPDGLVHATHVLAVTP